jgi:uncharacterized membrane protein
MDNKKMKGGKMAKKKGSLIGSWAFLVGVVLALLIGLFGSITSNIVYVLAVIGIIVGLFNIADEEAHPFLMSGAVLIIASALGKDVVSQVPALSSVLHALSIIFVPATIIVAIKNVFSLARH